MVAKRTLYLAGPHGFSEMGCHSFQLLEKALKDEFEVINPFTLNEELSAEIIKLQKKLHEPSEDLSYREIIERIKEINFEIGKKNAEALKNADLILAILDGADVDSGTAAEIGFAFGLKKKIFGYRNDFRQSGDNLGAQINLQVEYFIKASKGIIFSSIEDLKNACPDGFFE